MVNVDAKVLKQLKNLSRLSAAQLDKLARNLTVRTFKKGEIVFGQDEQARFVYLLISGVARVSYNGHERQTIVSLLPPGEFFGLDSLMPESCHPFRCDAFETSTIGSIRPQVFVADRGNRQPRYSLIPGSFWPQLNNKDQISGTSVTPK